MFKSAAEESIRMWNVLDKRVYKFFSPLVRAEFVTFKKTVIDISDPENPRINFECVPEYSTTDLGVINYERFMKMLTADLLVFEKDWTYNTDVVRLKTGGCTCGSWILKDNEYLHDRECWLHKHPTDGSMPATKK